MLFGSIGGSSGWGSPTTIRIESGLPGPVTRPPSGHNPATTPHGTSTILPMTMPSSTGGSGNPSTPSMPRPSDTTPPRSNASSVRSVIDSSFSVLPPLFLDGGANAGRTPHAPPPSINLHSTDVTFPPLHLAGSPPSSGPTNLIVPPSKARNPPTPPAHSYSPLPPRPISTTSPPSIIPLPHQQHVLRWLHLIDILMVVLMIL